jgi:hypothetical protein
MPEPMKVYRESVSAPAWRWTRIAKAASMSPSLLASTTITCRPSAPAASKYAARFVLELQEPWTARKIGDRRRLGNVPSLWQASYVAPLSEDIDLK